MTVQGKEQQDTHSTPGYDRLWGWFGLSYASWLTIPRVLMHEMPDDWQMKMAKLLEQYNEVWDFSSINLETAVSAKKDGKFAWMPKFLCQYRHPLQSEIEAIRRKK